MTDAAVTVATGTEGRVRFAPWPPRKPCKTLAIERDTRWSSLAKVLGLP